MAKKKAQHLYEILAHKSEQVQPLPVSAPAPAQEKKPAAEPAAPPPQRRRVEVEQPPVPAPVPAGRGQERVLENVVQLRRDTLIVGVLLVIVAIVVAFFIGRATAPGAAPKGRDLGVGLADEVKKEGPHFEPGTSPAPEPDVGKQENEAGESAQQPPGPEEQSAAQPLEEEYEIRLSSLPENMTGAKESLDKAREYLVKKGYPAAEVIKKGSHWVLRVHGYADSAKAQAAQRELAELEYQGRRDFADSQVRRMSRE
jgi:hypothetical protein